MACGSDCHFHRQAVGDFEFSWSCVNSWPVTSGKRQHDCLDLEGSLVQGLDQIRSSTLQFTPSDLKLRPNTVYEFEVQVRAGPAPATSASTRSLANVISAYLRAQIVECSL